ncbi:MAG: hypothetical protein Q9191_000704 [Dirinaria sp. TL-2023a]
MDPATSGDPPLSKNKLKKLRRDEAWEAGREARRIIRREKNKERRERKRATRDLAATQQSDSLNGHTNGDNTVEFEEAGGRRHPQHIRVPITIVIDCGFDELMLDTERKSLASQITRCYSDNHKAPYQVHLAISSFGGHLKERFDTVLAGHHRSWKGVKFLEQDSVDAANQAEAWMRGSAGGELAGALESNDTAEGQSNPGETIYLTSDSPNTLSSLSPYSTYIIGGLVDRNRHKGICYKKAMDRGIKTAKLPIGDYMQMTSRFVLSTNQVNEIMLRWIECGKWGEAFMKVMPKRKGGVLKPECEEQQHVRSEEFLNSETEASALEGAAEVISGQSDVEVDNDDVEQGTSESGDCQPRKKRRMDSLQPDDVPGKIDQGT